MRPLTVLLICALAGSASATDKRPLAVAISTDMPPYVMQRANEGLAVAILRAALPNRMAKFTPAPTSRLLPPPRFQKRIAKLIPPSNSPLPLPRAA